MKKKQVTPEQTAVWPKIILIALILMGMIMLIYGRENLSHRVNIEEQLLKRLEKEIEEIEKNSAYLLESTENFKMLISGDSMLIFQKNDSIRFYESEIKNLKEDLRNFTDVYDLQNKIFVLQKRIQDLKQQYFNKIENKEYVVKIDSSKLVECNKASSIINSEIGFLRRKLSRFRLPVSASISKSTTHPTDTNFITNSIKTIDNIKLYVKVDTLGCFSGIVYVAIRKTDKTFYLTGRNIPTPNFRVQLRGSETPVNLAMEISFDNGERRYKEVRSSSLDFHKGGRGEYEVLLISPNGDLLDTGEPFNVE